jgi:hypothetical protein
MGQRGAQLLQGTLTVAILPPHSELLAGGTLQGANRMMRSRALTLNFLIAAIACVASPFSSQLCAADFSGVGYLAPDDNISTADALSGDGSSIVGTSLRTFQFQFPQELDPRHYQTYRRAFIRDSAGMRSLESPPYGSYFGLDRIYDVAPFGSAAIVYRIFGAEYFNGRVFGSYQDLGSNKWTPSGNFSPFPQGVYPNAFGGSDSIYVGRWDHDRQSTAFRSTPASGIESIGPQSSEAVGVSANGQVVVGNAITGFSTGWTRPPGYAFRWTPAGGLVSLGEGTYATGVSGDGRVVIGENFVWTEAGGKQTVSPVHAGAVAALQATTFDGSIAVGNDQLLQISPTTIPLDGPPLQLVASTAIIWDPVNGSRDLKNVLETQYGLSLAGWYLTDATDISDDGRSIIGNGINPQGEQEGWVAHLNPVAVPEPAAWALLTIGASTVLRLRRRGL